MPFCRDIFRGAIYSKDLEKGVVLPHRMPLLITVSALIQKYPLAFSNSPTPSPLSK